jgi:DNA-binding XRE family transcriptional regulator
MSVSTAALVCAYGTMTSCTVYQGKEESSWHKQAFLAYLRIFLIFRWSGVQDEPFATLYPCSVRTLLALGKRMKDARLRRHFSAETVAARAGINRQTLTKIESGSSSVTMENYFQVLVILRLDKDILLKISHKTLLR